jgi:hypothetical protein
MALCNVSVKKSGIAARKQSEIRASLRGAVGCWETCARISARVSLFYQVFKERQWPSPLLGVAALSRPKLGGDPATPGGNETLQVTGTTAAQMLGWCPRRLQAIYQGGPKPVRRGTMR